MRFTRSHYQTCLEADLLTDSSRLRSSKHDSSASVTAALVRCDRQHRFTTTPEAIRTQEFVQLISFPTRLIARLLIFFKHCARARTNISPGPRAHHKLLYIARAGQFLQIARARDNFFKLRARGTISPNCACAGNIGSKLRAGDLRRAIQTFQSGRCIHIIPRLFLKRAESTLL